MTPHPFNCGKKYFCALDVVLLILSIRFKLLEHLPEPLWVVFNAMDKIIE